MKRGACIALWMNFAWLASEPSWAVENWSGEDYDLHAGDFNGDRTTDLLFIARDPALGDRRAAPGEASPARFEGLRRYSQPAFLNR